MKSLSIEIIQQLLDISAAPCLSLYMPAHRSHPENTQDVTRFNNLIKELESSLLQKYSPADVQKYLEPFESLSNDNKFWNHSLEGLAVFGSKDFFRVVGLQKSVDELAIVADSFHTKPLRKYLQSADRYYVLGLSQKEVRLFEGNRDSLTEIELSADFPKTMTEALGDELTEKFTTVGSYGGSDIDGSVMHHGHGGRKEETDKDAERFFRLVSNAVYDNYSKLTGLPLILVALAEHHNLFQRVSKNPTLEPKSIALNPTSISTDKLKDLAWEIMEPEYLKKLDGLADRFKQAMANGKGTDNIKDAAVAAIEGRIDTLIIEEDRVIAARITNLVTGNIQNKDLSNPKVDDLLDDMGELVTKKSGSVIVFPTEKMPSQTGLAAIFRY